jgi:hypothetical protein
LILCLAMYGLLRRLLTHILRCRSAASRVVCTIDQTSINTKRCIYFLVDKGNPGCAHVPAEPVPRRSRARESVPFTLDSKWHTVGMSRASLQGCFALFGAADDLIQVLFSRLLSDRFLELLPLFGQGHFFLLVPHFLFGLVALLFLGR